MTATHFSGPVEASGSNTVAPFDTDATRWRVPKVAVLTVAGVVATTGGAVGAWQNPESGSIHILRATLYVTTKSTGAAALDIGTTATSATTSSDTLLDGVDVGTAAGTFDNITEKGTNGKSRQTLASGKWVTVTGSADSSGLVGKLYIEYVDA